MQQSQMLLDLPELLQVCSSFCVLWSKKKFIISAEDEERKAQV